MEMTHGSICTGIGVFDEAARICGIETVWQIEKDPFCIEVNKLNFPNVKKYGDIKHVKEKELKRVNIISAGIPCQPFSTAGKRRGVKDDRHIWDEVRRIIRHVKPTWCIIENVVGILSVGKPVGLLKMGRPKVHRGKECDHYKKIQTYEETLFVGEIIKDFEEMGYALPKLKGGTTAIFTLPAAAVGALHRRERVFIVAHNNSPRCKRSRDRATEKLGKIGEEMGEEIDTNHNGEQLHGDDDTRGDKEKSVGKANADGVNPTGIFTNNGSPRGNKGGMGRIAFRLEAWLDGYKKGWASGQWEKGTERTTKSSALNRKRIRALGNAVQLQVAVVLFSFIKEIEEKEEQKNGI
jgi:DNA (cytosine-5)-methyltransferase 1